MAAESESGEVQDRMLVVEITPSGREQGAR